MGHMAGGEFHGEVQGGRCQCALLGLPKVCPILFLRYSYHFVRVIKSFPLCAGSMVVIRVFRNK